MEQSPFYEREKLYRPFPFLAWDNNKPGFWFPLHWHIQVEILLILQGKLNVIIDGNKQEGRQGDIVVIDTGQIHGFSDPSPDARVRIFQFGLEIFYETLEELRAREHSPVFRRKSIIRAEEDGGLRDRLAALLSDIYTEYRDQAAGYRLAVIGGLYELVMLLLRKLPAREIPRGERLKRKTYNERLERVFSFIGENFDDPDFCLDMAAEKSGLTRFYFSRFLKTQTGQSFNEHLARIRLHRAEQYLIESELPVTEIAYLCGFNSLTTFNRLFKAYTGSTPSVYRSGKSSKIPAAKKT
ncbi:MAG: AraC family transcriptional regulator [Treponema sp.]|nr:AraC family transcriptional regulator [Treponema sp.]